ncbi:MAG: CCA tRNA nucleotidyltransferase [Lachnospiraceae bacterium]|nr:CCA tRNA nucleotidyltransferase [Lachnospiraceae bacterium]
MKINLPKDVSTIISILEAAGFEAYAVGGCVRDVILGRTPDDWDITTSAKPGEIKSLFKKTVDTGIQHGTVTVLMNGNGYEVTTYRIDGIYEDARHPKEVSFTSDLKEDLKRRDFTINALAYNDSSGLIDEFDGIGDLNKGIIRCVGDPTERFSEDALRMMRAVRFAAQLGFEIDPDTRSAASKLAPNLKKVSVERILTELTKLICSDHPMMLKDCYEMGLTAQFIPEFDKCMTSPQNISHHCYDVGEHILHTMDAIRPDRVLRFTMLMHDIAKPEVMTVDEDGIIHNKGHAGLGAKMSGTILRRLHADNALIDSVKVLVEYHDWRFEADKRSVRRAMNRIGYDLFPMMIEVKRADIAGQSDYKREEKLSKLDEIEKLYLEIKKDNEAVQIKDLAVTGRDIIDAGIKTGPEIGGILKAMLDHVLDYPEDNTKETLMKLFVYDPAKQQ